MTGIAELFASFNGADRYEMQLELWCFSRAAMRAEYFRDWRTANAESIRRYDAQRVRQPRREKTNGTCRQCARLAVAGKKSCAEHLAKARARAATSGKRAA